MTDYRYLHTQHIEGGAVPPSWNSESTPSFTVFFPGWVDADTHPWAKRLSTEPCEKADCRCRTRPLKLQSYELRDDGLSRRVAIAEGVRRGIEDIVAKEIEEWNAWQSRRWRTRLADFLRLRTAPPKPRTLQQVAQLLLTGRLMGSDMRKAVRDIAEGLEFSK